LKLRNVSVSAFNCDNKIKFIIQADIPGNIEIVGESYKLNPEIVHKKFSESHRKEIQKAVAKALESLEIVLNVEKA
jgi:hypothetical protein